MVSRLRVDMVITSDDYDRGPIPSISKAWNVISESAHIIGLVGAYSKIRGDLWGVFLQLSYQSRAEISSNPAASQSRIAGGNVECQPMYQSL